MPKPPIDHHTLIEIHNDNYSYFKELWNDGDTNEKYRRGDPWSESEKQDIEDQGRQAYAMGLVPNKLNTICAEQRKNRTSFKVEAKNDVNDEIKAELSNLRMKDFETANEFKYTESDIFDSGVGVKYGVGAFRIGKDKYGNDIVLFEEVDYKDFIWDKNARTYTKKDGVFAAEFDRMYRFEVAQRWGKKKAAKLAGDSELKFGRDKDDYWLKAGRTSDLDMINVITHYHKQVRKIYKVFFDGKIVEENTSKKDAEKTLRMLNLPYITQNQNLPDQEIITDEKVFYDKYTFTYTTILDYEITDLEDFPYSIYQSFHFKDQVWCLTDILKHPQLFIDRLVSQIDYSFGVDVKNVNEVNVSYLADGWDYKRVVDALAAGEPIPVIRSGAVTPVPSAGANPQYMQMMGIMQQILDDLGGGRSFGGLKDDAGESGVAIEKKIAQGQLIAALFIDNLSRWKLDVGEKLMWHLNNYDTAERAIRVHGGSLSPEMLQLLQTGGIYQPSVSQQGMGYVTINSDKNKLTYLNDFEYELLVTQAELSETQKNQRLGELALLNQLAPGVVTPDIYMEYIPMSYTLKQKVMANYQKMMAIAEEQRRIDNETKQVNMASQISGMQKDRETGDKKVAAKPGENKNK